MPFLGQAITPHSSCIAASVPADLYPDAIDNTNDAVAGGSNVTGNVLGDDGLGDEPTTVTAILQGVTSIPVGVATATANGGTITINANGAYTYVPSPAASTETFTYTIQDADGDTSTADLVITVAAPPGDADALAFFAALESDPAPVTLSTPQKDAVTDLVTALKACGAWAELDYVWPMVGGTAAAHSYNLKNTATGKVTWNGAGVHSSQGWLGANGVFGNTGLAVNSTIDTSNYSWGGYRTTYLTNLTTGVLIGATYSTTGTIYLYDFRNTGSSIYSTRNVMSGETSPNVTTDTSGVGFFAANVDASNNIAYRNSDSNSVARGTYTPGPNCNIFLGAGNFFGGGTSSSNSVGSQMSFFFLGRHITDMPAVRTAVAAYQAALSRTGA